MKPALKMEAPSEKQKVFKVKERLNDKLSHEVQSVRGKQESARKGVCKHLAM